MPNVLDRFDFFSWLEVGRGSRSKLDMPPKNQPPPVAAVPEEDQNKLNLCVKLSSVCETTSLNGVIEPASPLPTNLRIRFVTEWFEGCGNSEWFGKDDLGWMLSEQGVPPNNQFNSIYRKSIGVKLDSIDKIRKFDAKPGVFAVISLENNNVATPLGFLYIDCSPFLIENKKLIAKLPKLNNIANNNDIQVEFSATIDKCLLSKHQVIVYEPMIIDITSIRNFPLPLMKNEEDEVMGTSTIPLHLNKDSVFIYGDLNFFEINSHKTNSSTNNNPSNRLIFGYPFVDATNSFSSTNSNNNNTDTLELSNNFNLNNNNYDQDSDSDQEENHNKFYDTGVLNTSNNNKNKFKITIKTCILPGLHDLLLFKDSLTSSTYQLELYQFDINNKIFNNDNNNNFQKLLLNLQTSLTSSEPVSKTPTKGKAPAVPGIKPDNIFTEITPLDTFLLSIIMDELHKSRLLLPHGSIRFRLEQLLSTSNDLLLKFAQKRNNSKHDDIIVKEEMMLEVLLEKPAKPEKWDLPSDISLRSALVVAKQKEDKKMNLLLTETNNNNLSTTQIMKKKLSLLPYYERFSQCETYLELSVELHRKLQINKIKTVANDHHSEHHTPSHHGDSHEVKSHVVHNDNHVNHNNHSHDLEINDLELQAKLKVTPFTRMVIIINYLNDEMVFAINDAINKVNTKALPNIQGTLKSYSLNEKELEESSAAKLDIISGFTVIDDDIRMYVIEGLAANNCGMESIFIDLPRQHENNSEIKILCNPNILFPNRLYPMYSPTLKYIRIRNKLDKLIKKPEIYNRNQVEEDCFIAIDKIMALKRAEDMKSTKDLDSYPSFQSLNKIELLYGEAISKTDLDGTLKRAFNDNFRNAKDSNHHNSSKLLETLESPTNMIKTRKIKFNSDSTDSNDMANNNNTKQRIHNDYIPTDCRNERYDNILKTRPQHRVNYIIEQTAIKQEAYNKMLRKRDIEKNQFQSTIKSILLANNMKIEETPKIYLYSTQSLNYNALAMNTLRNKAKKDLQATYSFSSEFISSSIAVVDTSNNNNILTSNKPQKELWMTKNGFLYPKPKKREELIRHDKKPSDARIEELKEPYRDESDYKALYLQSHKTNDELKTKENGYKIQLKPQSLFGALEPLSFEQEFQLKLIGNDAKLPRGLPKNDNIIDEKFFKSVHLGGEEQTKNLEAAQKQEKELWKSKVVVDSIDFKMSGFKIRDVPLQMDRTKDILKSEPKKESLKFIRTMHNSKGRDISYHTTPLSILNNEPYVPNATEKALVRQTDRSKFITIRDVLNNSNNNNQSGSITGSLEGTESKINSSMIGNNLDFQKYIHKDTYTPKVVSFIAKKPILPQDRSSNECIGPKWDAPSSSK
eukprot:gene13134-17601_t